MRRRVAGIAMAALALALAVPGTALATPPQAVEFESPWTWGTAFDSFTGGTAPMCDSGTVTTVAEHFVGGAKSPSTHALWHKTFICDDGATFEMQMAGKIVWTDPVTTTFQWVVTGGTGYLTGLHGTGSGYTPVVDFDEGGGGTDHFKGTMHID